MPDLGDDRGGLVSIEANKHIPFAVKRVYYIFKTHEDVARGFHAHKELKQLVICVSGSCKMVMDNGISKDDVILNTPKKGLLIDSLVWREMHDFSEDCVLLVLASEYYDESDYIRNYDEFLKKAEP
ncbi:FdtA/QdtA family cupin domain-containing protein [Reinekea marina]|uniref:sugar 3,4-ketoisomerase n=1 Tax=Reinekea marina TaxID=1310421 RepID=UPI0025B58364|nr:FdtA/QdtA family cupin domain-containing protein [Reinekea marina]MDN3649302.1 FdtA/QdtA family cupin domain-containing protein [Reinekea marina]